MLLVVLALVMVIVLFVLGGAAGWWCRWCWSSSSCWYLARAGTGGGTASGASGSGRNSGGGGGSGSDSGGSNSGWAVNHVRSFNHPATLVTASAHNPGGQWVGQAATGPRGATRHRSLQGTPLRSVGQAATCAHRPQTP